ncbi:MAG TPA: hypothetical protein VI136_09625, partial [Verrucomicrobiae bacterium]
MDTSNPWIARTIGEDPTHVAQAQCKLPSLESLAGAQRARSEDDFSALAMELFRLQFAHNPVYRRVCEAIGVSPATAGRWQEIPAVPTTAFKDFDVTCLPPPER